MKSKLLFCASLLMAAQVSAMNLESPQVVEGESFNKGQIFNSWGCEGDNVSPELKWDDVPEGTKSFAVTMYDLMHLQAVAGGTG